MRLPAFLRHALLVTALSLSGCGHTVIHERLVPVQAPAAPDGVMMACAQQHSRVLPIHVNTRRVRQQREFDYFTFIVEYTDVPGDCSTGDVTLARPGRNAALPAEAVVKSRRYPDRPGTLICVYRMRNILEEGGIHHLTLHPSFADCPAQTIRYRHESQREFMWAVEK